MGFWFLFFLVVRKKHSSAHPQTRKKGKTMRNRNATQRSVGGTEMQEADEKAPGKKKRTKRQRCDGTHRGGASTSERTEKKLGARTPQKKEDLRRGPQARLEARTPKVRSWGPCAGGGRRSTRRGKISWAKRGKTQTGARPRGPQ